MTINYKLLAPTSNPLIGVLITKDNLDELRPWALVGDIVQLLPGNWLIIRNQKVEQITADQMRAHYKVVESYTGLET